MLLMVLSPSPAFFGKRENEKTGKRETEGEYNGSEERSGAIVPKTTQAVETALSSGHRLHYQLTFWRGLRIPTLKKVKRQ